jgi:hypothetical protein
MTSSMSSGDGFDISDLNIKSISELLSFTTSEFLFYSVCASTIFSVELLYYGLAVELIVQNRFDTVRERSGVTPPKLLHPWF